MPDEQEEARRQEAEARDRLLDAEIEAKETLEEAEDLEKSAPPEHQKPEESDS